MSLIFLVHQPYTDVYTVWPLNIQPLSNIWSRVQSPYDIRCLIGKKGYYNLALVTTPVLLFSKLLLLLFLGYLDPENVFLDNKNKYFSEWTNRYFGWKISTRQHRSIIFVHAAVLDFASRHWWETRLFECLAVMLSAFFLAETLVSSPRKMLIFTI